MAASIWMSIILGAVCGAALPLLPFMIVAVVATLGVVVAGLNDDPSILHVLFWALLVAVALQASYIAGLFINRSYLKFRSNLQPNVAPGRPELGRDQL